MLTGGSQHLEGVQCPGPEERGARDGLAVPGRSYRREEGLGLVRPPRLLGCDEVVEIDLGVGRWELGAGDEGRGRHPAATVRGAVRGDENEALVQPLVDQLFAPLLVIAPGGETGVGDVVCLEAHAQPGVEDLVFTTGGESGAPGPVRVPVTAVGLPMPVDGQAGPGGQLDQRQREGRDPVPESADVLKRPGLAGAVQPVENREAGFDSQQLGERFGRCVPDQEAAQGGERDVDAGKHDHRLRKAGERRS